jgi:succinate dehydrogenase flavin-adding protein (antitoxin of CptAB toxin-antitoxin module)
VDILDFNEIADYERLLLQDDQVLYSWFSDEESVPLEFASIFAKISKFIKVPK